MATDNSNQTVGSQSTNNNPTGNGNFSFSDGKWQSTDGSSLDSGSGFSGAATDSNIFASFIGGGNSSTTSEDGKYKYNYQRPLDERALTDTNNPFNQLIGVRNVACKLEKKQLARDEHALLN
ncbi:MULTISPECIES: hypothetical protein [unclassified Nostoc]|uniref:hypothetical protein n=1 Tax=unclassified Nostoc TaxID=2593658 RepID=UPI002AD5720D|nr:MULTISPECIES: hypothetical protein [unclassified Nostoc]MDZ8124617.1 hypothetical protein [Nostoc sp. CmiVER01]MDZ8223365.1 hypothetical protein [Nostoc sp. ChiVER01]